MPMIKFRMWNKDISSFIYFDLLDLCCEHYASKEKIYQSLLNDKDVKIMRYTGLKDKNGKEIYEDDILNYGDEKGVVKYLDGRYIVELFTEFGGEGYENLFNYLEDAEIIGNIYENSNLLTN